MRVIQYYLPFIKNRILCCIRETYGLTSYQILIILTWRLNTCILHNAVIPANTLKGTGAGIQELSGCRIKSGMTNYLIAGVSIWK